MLVFLFDGKEVDDFVEYTVGYIVGVAVGDIDGDTGGVATFVALTFDGRHEKDIVDELGEGHWRQRLHFRLMETVALMVMA